MIFYFTGTGNSQYTAEEIAKATGEKAIHIGSLVKSRKFSYTLEENERLGFVFPVYFGGIPNIITWFIKKLELTGTPAFTYAVITCGGSPIASDHMLKEKLAERDMTLDAVYELKLPDNYVLMYNLPTEEEADKETEEVIIN